MLAVAVLIAADGDSRARMAWLGVGGMVGSWVLLLAVFALEYGRQWALHQALDFPERPGTGDLPDREIDDFIYLAVQVLTTFASSDVAVLTTPARRLVTAHAIAAFVFSSVIVGLFVSAVLTLA